MNKRMKMFIAVIFALTMTLVGIAYADNVEIKLGSGDGFKVLDSGGSPLMDILSNGKVGIGTSPNYELDVSGDINFTGSLYQNGSAFSGGGSVPSGAVMFFNLSSCPSDWSELTAARGRVVLGLPYGGTLSGTVGTSLSNQGTKTIADVPSHTHTADPPSTSTSSDGTHPHTDSGHSHNMRVRFAESGAWYGAGNVLASLSETYNDDTNTDNASANIQPNGSHSHTVDIASFNTGSTGTTSVDVTMPYIQLLACQKD